VNTKFAPQSLQVSILSAKFFYLHFYQAFIAGNPSIPQIADTYTKSFAEK
jgi:hypothetical protein